MAAQECFDVDKKALQALLNYFDPSVAPEELPCRDDERKDITAFIEANLRSGASGCMYVSGVPGSGKTASVRLVMQELEKRKRNPPDFVFVELNGMVLSDPNRIFVDFYRGLLRCKKRIFNVQKTKRNLKISPGAALKKLDHLFSFSEDSRPAIVLIMDEIDAIVTKRQQYIYRILDWATQETAKLTVIAIANTLDLPERILSNRNQSRMGLKRLCFQPYNHEQILDILISRLRLNPDAVERDATELIARKVASVSGDIRRAFEICRSAIELALSAVEESTNTNRTPNRRSSKRILRCGRVRIDHVTQACNQANVKVEAVKHSSTQEKLLLKAAVIEYRRSGLEEMPFSRIWHHYVDLCDRDTVEELCIDELLDVVSRLTDCRLMLNVATSHEGIQDFTASYRLNVNPDDVDTALAKHNKR